MEELKRLRTERGWSQQRLADESGVNKATINQVEQGKRTPGIETLMKLATALNVELGDFFPKAQAPLPLEMGGGRGLQLWCLHASDLAENLEELAESAKSEKWERRAGLRDGAGLAASGVVTTIETLLEWIGTGLITDVSREEVRSLLREGYRLSKAVDRLYEVAAPNEEDVMQGVRERADKMLMEFRFRKIVETLDLTEQDREEIFA